MFNNRKQSGYGSQRYSYRAPIAKKKPKKLLHGLVILVLAIGIGLAAYHQFSKPARLVINEKKTVSATKVVAKPTSQPVAVNPCAANTVAQNIIVSISTRHLWACGGTSELYNSPVITGMDFLAADLTPTGTYHIYNKETKVVLKGCDTTGCWDDPVSYWMPFLDNQYGEYGFHDATWRSPSDFGNISPDSSDASHGCVECPLATAKWLYGWAQIGTTVTIES